MACAEAGVPVQRSKKPKLSWAAKADHALLKDANAQQLSGAWGRLAKEAASASAPSQLLCRVKAVEAAVNGMRAGG